MSRRKWPVDKWGNEYGYMGKPPEQELQYEVVLMEGKYVRIKEFVAHTFTMGDVEDPDLYAAQPLWTWQNTEEGKWVMENAIETPSWHRHADPITYGYRYAIKAKLKDVDYTFWCLKWGTK
jgi:hypothetical protein